MADLEKQMVLDALTRFEPYVRAADTDIALLEKPNYVEREALVDSLQITLDPGQSLAPSSAIALLQQASGWRVTLNAVHRQAAMYSNKLASLVVELENIWASLAPYNSRYENQVIIGVRMQEIRRRATDAATHATYCEAAYWSIQRTCDNINSLALLYDKAGLMGPPVNPG